MPELRPATSTDVDAICATVAAAFAADPAWSFMLGSGNTAGMQAFAKVLLLPRVERGTAWIADDGQAVAMWDRIPGPADPDDANAARWADFRAEVGEQAGRRITAYEHALEAVAPPRPIWYLGVLATHPDAQGRGLASALLARGVAAAADDGWDCWLETSTLANKEFYARRGFTTQSAVEVPGGPMTWWLRRR